MTAVFLLIVEQSVYTGGVADLKIGSKGIFKSEAVKEVRNLSILLWSWVKLAAQTGLKELVTQIKKLSFLCFIYLMFHFL